MFAPRPGSALAGNEYIDDVCIASSRAVCHIDRMKWLELWGGPASRDSVQLGLHEAPRNGRGGYRMNAGRKRTVKGGTAHRERPALKHAIPVHITLRAAAGLPSFREPAMARAIGSVIRAMRAVRDDFRILQPVQATHLHLIVEADDERVLLSAVRSFQTRATKLLNHHVLGRKRGRVWGDRYFRVDLTTPTQARHALAYVLQNGAHQPWRGAARREGPVLLGALVGPLCDASGAAERDLADLAITYVSAQRALGATLARRNLADGGTVTATVPGRRLRPSTTFPMVENRPNQPVANSAEPDWR